MLDVGSSMEIILVEPNIARAIDNFLLFPPLNDLTLSSKFNPNLLDIYDISLLNFFNFYVRINSTLKAYCLILLTLL